MQKEAVGGRRPMFAQLAEGLDRQATLRLLKKGTLSSTQHGALRNCMMGGLFGNARAAKWNGSDRRCTRCGQADETVRHRLWECPAWERLRSKTLGDVPAPWLWPTP